MRLWCENRKYTMKILSRSFPDKKPYKLDVVLLAMCETYSVAYFLFFKVRRLCFNFSMVSFGNPFSFNFRLRSLILSEASSSSVTIELHAFSSIGSSMVMLSSTVVDEFVFWILSEALELDWKTCSSSRSNESKSWLNASNGLNKPKSE